MSILRKLCPVEPARRKFLSTIGHVFSSKDAELEHLFGRQLGRKSASKRTPHWFRAKIDIALLHFVIHFHAHRLHLDCVMAPLRFVDKSACNTDESGLTIETTEHTDFIWNFSP